MVRINKTWGIGLYGIFYLLAGVPLDVTETNIDVCGSHFEL